MIKYSLVFVIFTTSHGIPWEKLEKQGLSLIALQATLGTVMPF